MISVVAFALSAAIILAFGLVHLLYTFRGPRFFPRARALQAAMREVTPVITRATSMWKCWIGFNASHSLGAMLFGMVYGYLALMHPAFLFQSTFLLTLGLGLLLAYAWLAKVYWFSVPFTGILIALLSYLFGLTSLFARLS